MRMTFRWYGAGDPVSLARIRQIPGVTGIVSALHAVPAGVAWTREGMARLRDEVERAGLSLAVVESIPVHEDIKLGRPGRDRLIDAWCESLAAVGAAGVPVVCWNFMPVFDWMRTSLAMPLADGSEALAYDDAALAAIDLSHGTAGLPGWGAAYDAAELGALREAYRGMEPERLWEHLAHFLERVVPAAESAGVLLALHPDDPPWPVLGLPRILGDGAALDRLLSLVDRPANGVTLCTGSLGASPRNDVPAIARRLAARGRIHFAHCRNVAVTGERRFHETAHPSACGTVDMLAVLRALRDGGFDGPIRPDHGRAIWGEHGRPGYGLYDRALGAMYLQGVWEGITREPAAPPDAARARARAAMDAHDETPR
ncbi:MAG TPA: mannonate dehydratase [Gemmatimonadaceae bacterium]